MKKPIITLVTLLCFMAGVYGTPLHFIPNAGQWDGAFDFRVNTLGYDVFFEKHAITFLLSDYSEVKKAHHSDTVTAGSLAELEKLRTEHEAAFSKERFIKNHAYKVEFLNATPSAIMGEDKMAYYRNYFLGKDSSKWKGHVAVFSGIRYNQLYPGIDLTYKADSGHNIKYEFIVAPHAMPQSIRMRYSGVAVSIAEDGNMNIKTSLGNMVEHAPYSFQVIGGKRITVPSHFTISNGIVTFSFPEGYDPAYELVIDPVVDYQTYSGATDDLFGQGSSYSADGRMFSLATAFSNAWPTTTGAYQTTFSGLADIALNVYSSNGANLLYATYIGGSGRDEPSSVSANSLGEAVIVGLSSSTDFPVSTGCLQPINKGLTDGIAVVLSSNGSALLSGSYYGSKGDEEIIEDVAWANDTTFYVYGKCGGNTTTPNKLAITMPPNAYKVNNNGRYGSYVLKLNSMQTQLLAGTYIGHSPSGRYYPKVLRLDEYTSEVLIGGYATNNANYPVTANAFQQPSAVNDWYGTISKFDAELTTLQASSCLYNLVAGIDTDPDGNIYAIGKSDHAITASPGVYAENDPIFSNTYLVKMTQDLTNALISTNLPPNLFDDNFAFERSNCGHFYMYYTSTHPFIGTAYNGPATPNTIAGGGTTLAESYYLMELDKDFQNLVFGGWLGLVFSHWHSGTQDIDPEGRIYANQCTDINFQFGTTGAWRDIKQNGFAYDAAAIVVDMELVRDSIHADISVLPDTVLCLGSAFQFTGSLSGPIDSYAWNFGDGSANETTNPTPEHTYTTPGTYQVTLEASNPDGCDFVNHLADSITVTALAPESVTVYPEDTVVCNAGSVEIKVEGGAAYEWTPADAVDNPSAAAVRVSRDGETNLSVTITDNHNCVHHKDIRIGLHHAVADAGPDRLIVLGKKESVILDGSGCIGANIYWDTDPTLSSHTSLTPAANPRQTTWYFINAEDHTCNSRDSAKVTVAAFGSPNAFSPNGDGLNDLFKIFTNDDTAIFTDISIFNRFGERVFYSSKNEGWDGNYKGRPCDMGTYFYSATVTIEANEYKLKGDITLIR